MNHLALIGDRRDHPGVELLWRPFSYGVTRCGGTQEATAADAAHGEFSPVEFAVHLAASSPPQAASYLDRSLVSLNMDQRRPDKWRASR